MTSIQFADDHKTTAQLKEKQLAAAILLQAIEDLTVPRFRDDAAAFVFGSDSENVSSREYWLALAGLPLDSLQRLQTLSRPEIQARLKSAGRRGQR